jgi:hypothetical protein
VGNEAFGRLFANAGTATGDDRYFSFEVHTNLSSVVKLLFNDPAACCRTAFNFS